MHLSFLALLTLSAATALAAPVPGESDELGKSEEAGQAASSDKVDSLYQCLWEFQRSQDPSRRLPSYKTSIAFCQKILNDKQVITKQDLQEKIKKADHVIENPIASTKQEHQEEIQNVDEGTENAIDNPDTHMSSLVRLPALSGIADGIRKAQFRPLGLPSIPGLPRVPGVPGGLRAFPF